MFVAKEMGKHIFNKLLKKLQKFDETVWAKEMKDNYGENAYFYDWITNFVNVWVHELSMKMWYWIAFNEWFKFNLIIRC